ncbi:WD40-repeat-containing domain protein [Lactifluus volemus]|nr:WD40-repeat-containing domain protein [Lactifluus volemus]
MTIEDIQSHRGSFAGTSIVAFGSGKLVALWDAQWSAPLKVQAHTKAVSALCVDEEAGCIVSGGSDSKLKVWKIAEQDDLQEVETIFLKGRYPLSMGLAELPQSGALILAVGSTDRHIQIFTRSEDTFVPSATIPGHEDWVRAISFRPSVSSSEPLILASGSQDANIRLWNIEPVTRTAPTTSHSEALSDEILDAFEASLGEVDDGEEGGRQISLKKHILTVKTGAGGDSTQRFSITFDALLVGHEAGVTSLAWRPSPTAGQSRDTLLSTSTDSSLILWSPVSVSSGQDGSSSALWINQQRFGDVGGQRLGGFVGGLWTTAGSEALAWGWSGWGAYGTRWSNKSITWSPRGEYLISAGLDQTTRIHAALPTDKGEKESMLSWHEIGRPQIHGYDLVGVVSLDPLRFITVADEKVARVFGAPRGFVQTMRGLGAADLSVDEEKLPVSATVPPLGLSNKATSDAELASVTLWPEVEKVFGHGYESITVAISSSRKLFATACKATTAKHATVHIYDTEHFRPFGKPLEGHTLTVTRISFSPDDQLVLTVSRDRTWRLFNKEEESGYVPIAVDKSHSRIIWDCAWAPDGQAFATASRDKTTLTRIVEIGQNMAVSPWNLAKWAAVAELKMPEAATAVAFAPLTESADERVLAVGLETGNIQLYTSTDLVGWKTSLEIKVGFGHIDHIHQLAWRPERQAKEHRQIASCGEDGTLKIFAVHGSVN